MKCSASRCKGQTSCLPFPVRSHLTFSVTFTFPLFPSGPTPIPLFSISSLSTSMEICIPLFLERRSKRGRKNNDSNFFPFSTRWLARECRLTAPVLATGTRMRSEREQLIKSSSRGAESQFCSPSTMISFYPDVMSYGTFALGNAMSSISAFHLLHKQGRVISFLSYLGNQSGRLGTGSTDTPMEMPAVFFMDHNTLEKIHFAHYFNSSGTLPVPNEGEPRAFRKASYVKSTIVAKYIEGQEVWVIFQKHQKYYTDCVS